LKKKFGDEGKLIEKLNQAVNPDKHGNVTVDALKDFILRECEEELVGRKFTKKDIEGFLSAFNYN